MPKVTQKSNSFSAGEISPRFYGRGDLPYYNDSCKELKNMTVKEHGGVIKRGGTEYIYSVGTAPPPAPEGDYVGEDCGRIGNYIDGWTFNPVATSGFTSLHVIDDVYLLIYDHLSTFTINADGTINKSLITSLEVGDLTEGIVSTETIKISETPGVESIFMSIAGLYGSYTVRVFTFGVDTTGAIREIDYYSYDLTSYVIFCGSFAQLFNPISDIYAVNTSNGIFTFRCSSDGTIEKAAGPTEFVKDHVYHYPASPIAQFGLSGFCIPSKNMVLPRYYWSYYDIYELRSYTVDASGGITYHDAMDLGDETQEFVDGTLAGFDGFLLLDTVYTDIGGGSYTNYLNVHTIDFDGYNFGTEIDSIELTPDTGYWMNYPKSIWIGGQGYMVIYKYGTSHYTYIGASTWYVRPDGTLSDQLASAALNLDIWDGPATFPYPVYVEGSDGIWLNGNATITHAYGHVYTSNIYGSSYCLPYGNCDKYGYR